MIGSGLQSDRVVHTAEQPNESIHSTRTSRNVYRRFFFAPPFFLSGAWVRADPATLLTFFDDDFFLSRAEAFDATRFEVFSFFAISHPFL